MQQPGNFRKKRRLGFTGMTWLWIVLGLFFLTGGVMSALRKNFPSRDDNHYSRVSVIFWRR